MIYIILQYTLSALLIVLTIIFAASASSIMVRFGTSTDGIGATTRLECDPLDATECRLPFPSFHMLQNDIGHGVAFGSFKTKPIGGYNRRF